MLCNREIALMMKERRTTTIDPESELGRALGTVDDAPLVLERGRERFRVIRDREDPWKDYDPEKVRAGLKKVAGLLSPEEGDRIIESIYRGREEGTRPINRP
jgi:hypothetical protein